MYQKRRDSECIRLIAPAANSFLAALTERSLYSRSTRMNVVSSFWRALFSNRSASSAKRLRSASVARRAALRTTSRSTSRRSSISRSCPLTLMSETITPRRGRICTRRSRARRCSASRIGVRPMPSRSDSIASDTALPGGSSRRTINSSSAV
jgi:hypothetical protein